MKLLVLGLACCMQLAAGFPIAFKPANEPTVNNRYRLPDCQLSIQSQYWGVRGIPSLSEAFQKKIDTICCDSAAPVHWVNVSPYTMSNQNPNDTTLVISEAQIIALLDSLRAQMPCLAGIRTFGTRYGLENIPRLAKERGFKVIVGVWLGSEATQAGLAANTAQITNCIKIVQDGYADRVIVGSEVLYRNDLSKIKLIKYINQVKSVCQPLSIPVSCADVYYHLAANPDIIAACDFVSPNIYPFWEGVHIDYAMQRFHFAYRMVEAAAQGKPVFISETGWKSSTAGVGQAQASLVNAVKYHKAVFHWSEATGVEVCHFEAFDEPWKLPSDGGWGIFYNEGTLKPGMEELCMPITYVDTSWICDKIVGNGSDTIIFDYVPIIGSGAHIRGHVNFVAPCDYMIALYIKVPNSGWWTKPYFVPPFVPINSDGTWSTPYWTGGNDGQATEICAFLIPVNYWPPRCAGNAAIPLAVYQNALASSCYHRYILSPVSVSAQADTVCAGDTVRLTATGGVYYSWSPTGDTSAVIHVTPASSTTYTVTITDGMGGGATATISIIVKMPAASITASKTAVCRGEVVSLKATGGVTYKWSTGETTQSIQVQPDTTTVYTVTVTDERGCKGTASIVIKTTNPSFAIRSSPSSVFCIGEMVRLYPNSSSPDYTYLWSTGEKTKEIKVVPADTISLTYTLTITNDAGCSGTNAFSLKAGSIPRPAIMADSSTLCQGDSTTISAAGGAAYRWNTGDTTASIRVAPSYSRTYRVTVTNAAGCQADTLIYISVKPRPFAFAVAGGGTFCAGEPGVPVGLSDSESGISYRLMLGGQEVGTSITGTNSAISFGKQTVSGVYRVVATNTITGCTRLMADSAIIVVNQLPDVFNVTGGGDFCMGAHGVEVHLSSSQKGVNYQLSVDGTDRGLPIPGTDSTISFGFQTIQGLYTVWATDTSSKCSAMMSDTALVTIHLLPIVQLTASDSIYTDHNLPVTLMGNPPGGIYSGPGVSNNQFDPAIAGPGQHTVYYTYSDANGCVNTDSLMIKVVVSTGLPEGVKSMVVFPKPNNGLFYIQLDLCTPERFEISLISPIGQIVLNQWEDLPGGQTKIFIEKTNLPPGLYALIFRSEKNGLWTTQVPICR